MLIRAHAFFLAILTSFFVVACAEESAGPTDGATENGLRLAVLSPASAVILRNLGREDSVAARHGFDIVLDPALPVAGDQAGLDYETLLRTDPTDIILEQSAQEIPVKLEEFAEKHGWRVHTIPMVSLMDIRDAIGTLDAISSGTGEGTDAGAAMLTRFDRAILERPTSAKPLGRVLLLTWTDPIGVMGPASFHFELLAALGATPIPETGAMYMTIDAEDVLRMDPDSIVLLMPGRKDGKIEEALGPLADIHLRAVEEGRTVLINHPLGLTPSTSMIDLADELVRACESMPPIKAED